MSRVDDILFVPPVAPPIWIFKATLHVTFNDTCQTPWVSKSSHPIVNSSFYRCGYVSFHVWYLFLLTCAIIAYSLFVMQSGNHAHAHKLICGNWVENEILATAIKTFILYPILTALRALLLVRINSWLSCILTCLNYEITVISLRRISSDFCEDTCLLDNSCDALIHQIRTKWLMRKKNFPLWWLRKSLTS